MRGIFLLILIMSFGAACAQNDQECNQEFGEDKSPPFEVVYRIRNELNGYRLIDKKDCSDEVYWLAIPPDQPIDKPRVIGSDKLVVMDKETKEIKIIAGQ